MARRTRWRAVAWGSGGKRRWEGRYLRLRCKAEAQAYRWWDEYPDLSRVGIESEGGRLTVLHARVGGRD